MGAEFLHTSTLSNPGLENSESQARAYHLAFRHVTQEYLESCTASHPELGTDGWVRKCAHSFETFDARFPSLQDKRNIVAELQNELIPTRDLVADAFREVSETLGNWRLDVDLPDNFDPDPFDEDC